MYRYFISFANETGFGRTIVTTSFKLKKDADFKKVEEMLRDKGFGVVSIITYKKMKKVKIKNFVKTADMSEVE